MNQKKFFFDLFTVESELEKGSSHSLPAIPKRQFSFSSSDGGVSSVLCKFICHDVAFLYFYTQYLFCANSHARLCRTPQPNHSSKMTRHIFNGSLLLCLSNHLRLPTMLLTLHPAIFLSHGAKRADLGK
jgi:hypothetical protein